MKHGNSFVQSPERHRSAAQTTEDEQLDALLKACAEGRQSAFEQLYAATSAQLFGVLRRILRTDALAEEAMQETYIKVWNHAHKYEYSKSAPRTWLVSIARNHAIDILRKRQSREDVELNLDHSIMDVMAEHGQSVARQHEISQLLDICLQQLSASARECVVRAYCEGFSQEELSERLQRPIGTIKSWIRRSLISLKDCLDDHA
jgi:RNA polymerase sigma-70 factor (ECF subfamily)